MNTRTLRGLELTELGFGGAQIGNLGNAISDDVAQATVDVAWGGGIRYFDTAPHYGLGLSERRLGRALAGRERSQYVLSTKVGRLLVPNPHPTGSDLSGGGFAVPDETMRRFDFSGDAVRRSLESSLERLGVDRIDIVYVHDPDDFADQAIGEAIPALLELRDEGVIGAVGVGMNQWQVPLRCVQETDIDVVMLAGRWTLLDRSGEQLVEECATRGVGVVAAAPFNSGVLARTNPDASANFDYAPATPAVREQVRELAALCHRYGIELPTAALQFALCSDPVVSVVSGMRTSDHVTSALTRMEKSVPGEFWEQATAAVSRVER